MALNISSQLFYMKNQIPDIYGYIKHRHTRFDEFQGEK